jgi:hypothetical protein
MVEPIITETSPTTESAAVNEARYMAQYGASREQLAEILSDAPVMEAVRVGSEFGLTAIELGEGAMRRADRQVRLEEEEARHHLESLFSPTAFLTVDTAYPPETWASYIRMDLGTPGTARRQALAACREAIEYVYETGNPDLVLAIYAAFPESVVGGALTAIAQEEQSRPQANRDRVLGLVRTLEQHPGELMGVNLPQVDIDQANKILNAKEAWEAVVPDLVQDAKAFYGMESLEAVEAYWRRKEQEMEAVLTLDEVLAFVVLFDLPAVLAPRLAAAIGVEIPADVKIAQMVQRTFHVTPLTSAVTSANGYRVITVADYMKVARAAMLEGSRYSVPYQALHKASLFALFNALDQAQWARGRLTGDRKVNGYSDWRKQLWYALFSASGRGIIWMPAVIAQIIMGVEEAHVAAPRRIARAPIGAPQAPPTAPKPLTPTRPTTTLKPTTYKGGGTTTKW